MSDEIREKHAALIEQYEMDDPEMHPVDARESTLTALNYQTLQKAAADMDCYPDDPDKRSLRRALAEAGAFLGGVGDHRLYRIDGDGGEVVIESP